MLTATLAGRHPACNLRVQPATLSVPGTLQSQACIQPADEWYTVFALLNVAVRAEAFLLEHVGLQPLTRKVAAPDT